MNSEAMTQLATRIPSKLMKEMRVHCVQSDVKIMDFIIQAVTVALAKAKRHK